MLKVENALAEAYVIRDVNAYERWTAPQFVSVTDTGHVIARGEWVKNHVMEDGNKRQASVRDDVKIRIFGDVAAITARSVTPRLDGTGRTFLEIHVRSVRGLAAPHYPAHVIATWAPPVTDEAVRRFLKNRDQEIRLLAELDAQPVGLGALVVDNAELRACYVASEAARRGVGSALVREMERIARDRGLTHLELHASMNSEPFCAALGYEALGREEHSLRSGYRMVALKMRKSLGP